jgi:hypothetical protein
MDKYLSVLFSLFIVFPVVFVQNEIHLFNTENNDSVEYDVYILL